MCRCLQVQYHQSVSVSACRCVYKFFKAWIYIYMTASISYLSWGRDKLRLAEIADLFNMRRKRKNHALLSVLYT